ncbi:hypothetical protein VTK73DRAFT_5260 [Phialemonium thermophilum]|uniref:Uncharacterized protein n=1 Tax=Phialemonium thermophilum TaxID=223376 RepID=A0ABR3V3A1_9PEZI
MVISMLAIGACSLPLFLLVEWKLAKLPMMPLSIFATPAVAVMLAQNFLFGAVYQSFLYYVPMYLQNAHGYSPLLSAAISAALVCMQTLASILSGQYISRRKRYGEVIWAGFGLWTLALRGCGLSLLYTRQTPAGVIIVPLMLVGTGVGFIFQPTLVALQAHVPQPRRAVITSNRNFFRCAGGAVGLAVSAAVLQATLRKKLPSGHGDLAADSTYAVPDLSHLPAADAARVLDAYMDASHAVFELLIPIIGVCFLGCVFIRDRGLRYEEDPTPSAAPAEEEKADGMMSASLPAPLQGVVVLDSGSSINEAPSSLEGEKQEVTVGAKKTDAEKT